MGQNPSKPSPMTRADCAALFSMEGRRLSGVIYHYLPPADGIRYAGGLEGVDSDIAAVDMVLDDRQTTCMTWAMAGDMEGLAILEGESYSGIGTEVLDAAGREAWREHIGKTITSVATSWQISGEACPETLWAVRIDFGAGSIVIALGTAPDLDYAPNELVVVHDMEIARSYRPPHVADSAWGGPADPESHRPSP